MVVLGCSGLQIVICAVNVSHRVGNVGMNRVQAHLLAFAQIKLMHPHALQLRMVCAILLVLFWDHNSPSTSFFIEVFFLKVFNFLEIFLFTDCF